MQTHTRLPDRAKRFLLPEDISRHLIVPFPYTLTMWNEDHGSRYQLYTAWKLLNAHTAIPVSEGCEVSFQRAVKRLLETGICRPR